MTDHTRWKDIRGTRDPSESDDVLGDADSEDAEPTSADFDPEVWIQHVVDQVEGAVASICTHLDRRDDTVTGLTDIGESLEVRVWQAPFPSPPGLEARISWSVGKGGQFESGETDVQPDDSSSWIREHVIQEIDGGFARLRLYDE